MYLRPPTQEQIDNFIHECGVSCYRFESFFGMPRGTIKVARTGYMPMPLKYWHIFYEKVIPTYGTGAAMAKKVELRPKVAAVVKKEHVIPQISSDDRLAAFR